MENYLLRQSVERIKRSCENCQANSRSRNQLGNSLEIAAVYDAETGGYGQKTSVNGNVMRLPQSKAAKALSVLKTEHGNLRARNLEEAQI